MTTGLPSLLDERPVAGQVDSDLRQAAILVFDWFQPPNLGWQLPGMLPVPFRVSGLADPRLPENFSDRYASLAQFDVEGLLRA
jgi:hypothetical protein